jgi:hypothetical protein
MTRHALLHSVTLSILCVISYWLITHMLARAFSVSRDDDLLGGMWAVVATVFVYRYGYEESVGAALSRMWATMLSFALCFIYLLFFPFHLWGLDADWGRGCRDVPAWSTGRHNPHGDHDCGRDGRRSRKPESCVETARSTIVGVAVGVVGVWTSLRSGQRRSATA